MIWMSIENEIVEIRHSEGRRVHSPHLEVVELGFVFVSLGF